MLKKSQPTNWARMSPNQRFGNRFPCPSSGKSHPWTNTSVGGNFRRTFRTIGPYEFPQEKVWTNDWSIWISPEIRMDQWRSKFSESFSLDRHWSIECSSLFFPPIPFTQSKTQQLKGKSLPQIVSEFFTLFPQDFLLKSTFFFWESKRKKRKRPNHFAR